MQDNIGAILSVSARVSVDVDVEETPAQAKGLFASFSNIYY